MQTVTSVNTPLNLPTRFAFQPNVSRTMSSREIANVTGKRHDNVMQVIRALAADQILTPESQESSFEHKGNTYACWDLSKRDSLVLVARLSPEFTASVVDRWMELEGQAIQPRELSTMDILQIAMESEKARLLLTIQVEAQAVKIHSMENLFKEGMTHTQFCKGLNGVNVMQVGNALEGRNWLFNESKSGLRWRVASYARDKYMTEHQVEITPHGKDPFISFTPVLLKKGAAKLYDLYLSELLPMKKTWDGRFTHDKALKEAV
ncbi:Rha family transcriptional regulator [Pseudomonas sp. CCC4.4]|uniref:Rha family transcriptional regulator n=1 Tax=Pseudomonas sp. CCC4.4 TaxID=3048612 RepID=UPI002B22C5AD|nr:Rha family transcriptional regulator [Pseudomonas sp. CCC4.4]MEB0170044.1 Rha family transcriptional regulator [Pseudomonas sp. CCC4.4]